MTEKKCPVVSFFEFASKKWTLQIIRVLGLNPNQRFKDLLNELERISPKTLTERLKELEKQKIISRTSFNEIPPRVEYTLTLKGKELTKTLTQIGTWVKKWESK